MFDLSHMWFLYAITAAVLWGFGYALSEQIIKSSLPFTFFMVVEAGASLLICLTVSILLGSFKPGLATIVSDKSLWLPMLAVTSAFGIGGYFIFAAIMLKNATLANMVEITYPIFTLFFAWLLFREVQITLSTALGGVLIMSGLILIFLKGGT